MASLTDSDDTSRILADTSTRLFGDLYPADHMPAADTWRPGDWAVVAEAGLPLALLAEHEGGFGIGAADALGLVRISARYAGALPLGDTMLANWLLASAGLPAADGPAAIAPVGQHGTLALGREPGGGWRLTGPAGAVPWGRVAESIAVVAESSGELFVARVPRTGWTASPDENMAGLPRDLLEFDAHLDERDVRPAGPGWSLERARAAGAAIRVQEIAGALEAVLAMTVAYAGERVQFGRPIGKQQAVQQQLAVLAGHAAAAGGAASIAADALLRPDGITEIAAAKVRAGEAAGAGSAIAHQVHGAMGFTAEHRLHVFTKRLWAWRDEFGSERTWSRMLGRLAIEAGPAGFWPFVTAIGRHAPAEAA